MHVHINTIWPLDFLLITYIKLCYKYVKLLTGTVISDCYSQYFTEEVTLKLPTLTVTLQDIVRTNNGSKCNIYLYT